MIKARTYRSNKGTLQATFASGLLGIAALFFTYQAYISYSEKSWPATTATINSVKIDSWHRRHSGMRYAPLVSYHFLVNGKTIDSYSRMESYESEEQAKHAALSYPQGQTLTVFYHPSHPDKTTTKPASELQGYETYALLCLVGSFGTRMANAMWKKRYVTRPKHSHPLNIGGP